MPKISKRKIVIIPVHVFHWYSLAESALVGTYSWGKLQCIKLMKTCIAEWKFHKRLNPSMKTHKYDSNRCTNFFRIFEIDSMIYQTYFLNFSI